MKINRVVDHETNVQIWLDGPPFKVNMDLKRFKRMTDAVGDKIVGREIIVHDNNGNGRQIEFVK
jgi:hypothetical protein